MASVGDEAPVDLRPPTFDDVKAAADRIRGMANHTPVVTSRTVDEMASTEAEPRELFFKCENMQRVGAFKFRGACNAVMKLSEEDAAKGVCTHSSGNHAQAVALAAKLRGIPAYIVMPSSAPTVKRNAVENTYNGIVSECEPTLQARETTAASVVEETGATFLHPYNHPDVIAGQGTIGLEFLNHFSSNDLAPLDALIVPIGGGGMISGICIAAKAMQPDIRIFAAEPLGADDAKRSVEGGALVPSVNPNTIADGLLTSMGSLTWPIVRDNVERVITVDEDEIVAAMRVVFERMKLVIEPSAAVGVAVAFGDEFKSIEGIGRVGIVLCGGNVNLDSLPWQTAE